MAGIASYHPLKATVKAAKSIRYNLPQVSRFPIPTYGGNAAVIRRFLSSRI
jgi:hypothetical protein